MNRSVNFLLTIVIILMVSCIAKISSDEINKFREENSTIENDFKEKMVSEDIIFKENAETYSEFLKQINKKKAKEFEKDTVVQRQIKNSMEHIDEIAKEYSANNDSIQNAITANHFFIESLANSKMTTEEANSAWKSNKSKVNLYITISMDLLNKLTAAKSAMFDTYQSALYKYGPSL